jgi:hypothetical protein
VTTRYGAAARAAIRRRDRSNETSSAALPPAKRAGVGHEPGRHKPKTIFGAHADELRQRCRACVFTLRGPVRDPADQRASTIKDRPVRSFIHTEKPFYKRGC